MKKIPTSRSANKSGGEIPVAESVDILSKAIAGFDFHVDGDDFILYELNRMIDEDRASFERTDPMTLDVGAFQGIYA